MSISSSHINRRIDHTKHKVYFSFRITFGAFLGLPLPQLFAHKERCIDFFFFHVRTDHDGGKKFLRQMQKKKDTVE